MQYDTARPYIASYVILRQDGKIAFVLRENTAWMNGYYSLPSGKIEENETYSTGAVREAKEEVGITIRPDQLRPVLVCHRNGNNETSWVDVLFEVDRWKGEVVNAEPAVHGEVAWLDPNNLPPNVVPNVVFMLEQIQAGNSYCEYGWDH